MKSVFINKQPVELYKILKFEGIRASGAEAKNTIAEGMVKLNGEVEIRKRKQVAAGDMIECDGVRYQVLLEG